MVEEPKGLCQRSRQNCRHSLADAVILSCHENGKSAFRATQLKYATAICGNMLVVTDARAEVIAEFVVTATEALG